MDVGAIKQYLSEHIDQTIELLEAVDYHHITMRGDEIRCAKSEDSNPTSVKLNVHTMQATIFSENVFGDIITLVDEKLGAGFRETLKYIVNFLGLSTEEVVKRDIRLPFGGYYKKISKAKTLDFKIEPLDTRILDGYFTFPSRMFLEDGISAETQIKYEIGYDVETGRITIPQYSINGDFVGVMGRINSHEVGEFEAKYMPITDEYLPRSKIVIGYHRNYRTIVEKDIAIIVESDKGVMQLDSMGLEVGLGLGKSHISEHQEAAIKGTRAKTIILALDEGLDQSLIETEALKLKSDKGFYSNKVGYIYDKDNKYLEKGSKNSPTDMGKEILQKLMTECIIWV